jgi:hypothetical protein
MAAVQKDFPHATATELAARSLEVVCRAPESRDAMRAICTSYNHVASLRLLAALSIVVALFLLLAVHYVGQRCRRDRHLLLVCFRTGTYLMTIATLGLVLSQALLLAATFYFGPAEFLGRILCGLILLTVLGAIVAVYRVVRLLFAFSKNIFLDVGGRLLSTNDAPELWNFVKSTAASVGTDPPQTVVVGTDATFFVTEAEVATTQGEVTGRTLYISIPLSHILSKTELRAIIGHEMAHSMARIRNSAADSIRYSAMGRARSKQLSARRSRLAVAGTLCSPPSGCFHSI